MLAAQLKVLPANVHGTGPRVNVNGENALTEQANWSLLSGTYARSLVIDHSELNGDAQNTTPRIGLQLNYDGPAQPFTGYSSLINGSGGIQLIGNKINLTHQGHGPGTGLDILVNSRFEEGLTAPPEGRNAIGIKVHANELFGGSDASQFSNYYVAAIEAIVDQKYRKDAFGAKLTIKNGNAGATRNAYGVSVTRDPLSQGSGFTVGIYSNISGSTNYAGHFTGNVLVNGSLVNASDQALKDEIADIGEPLGLLGRLQPRSYELVDAPEQEANNLHYGFIAQEVEEVFPELVRTFKEPAVVDERGEVVTEERELKGVNYIELIAILAASGKSQQATIDQLTDRVASLETELAGATEILGRLAECAGCLIDFEGLGFRQPEGVNKPAGKSGDASQPAPGGSLSSGEG